MNYRLVAKVLGIFQVFFALSMLVPLVAEYLGDREVGEGFAPRRGFALASAIGFAFGAALFAWGRRAKRGFFRKEGVLAVATIWFSAGLVGALPFALSGTVSYAGGVFETVSGLTTTGSSVMGAGGHTPRIESLPASILLWRSLLHWMGGLGIVVMFLVFLPALGITEKALFQAEIAGVSKEGLRPRIRQSAIALFRVYLVISVGLFLAYWLCGLSIFDAVNHCCATIATGGFSTQNYSVGEFNHLGVELIAITGMFLAGMNFGLFHRASHAFNRAGKGSLALRRRLGAGLGVIGGDSEFRFYAGFLAAVVVAVMLVLRLGGGEVVPDAVNIGRDHDYASLGGALRDAAFQSTSLMSSTGFANSNLLTWPLLAQAIIVVTMLCGASSGSTGGGLKAARVLVLFKVLARSLRRFLRPRAVEPVRVGGKPLEPEVIDGIVALFVVWILVLILGTLALLCLVELEPLSAFTSVVTCLGNMGPGLTTMAHDAAGNLTPVGQAFDISSYGSFGAYPATAKLMLAFIMLLGRLEVYTPLIVCMPGFWRR